MKKGDTWNPSEIDKKKLEDKVRIARHYLNALEHDCKRGSILTDLDYGYIHEAVEELYTICDIGSLAYDNAERQRKVKEQVLKNAK